MSAVKELARITKKSEGAIYRLARQLKRLPTIKEVEELKSGRPQGSKIYELAKETGRSRQTIYNLSWKLGRLPTKEEVLNNKKGRKLKYK